VQSGFVRTPKYAIGDRKVNLEAKRYRRKSGMLPYVEIGIGLYFVGMMAFAVSTYNFFALPFLALFVMGYFWAGFGTLYQEHQSRLRWLKQQRLAAAHAAR
jgi:hypothetical protein